MKYASLLIGLLLALLLTPFVVSIGYAPISVQGKISSGGFPLAGVQLLLSTSIDNTELISENVFTKDDGSFFAVITVPDPSVTDIEVTIVYAGELYVELMRHAHSWGRYEKNFDIVDTTLETTLSDTSISSPTSPDFEQDIESILDGEALQNDTLREKYFISIEPLASNPPLLEEPQAVPVSPSSAASSSTFLALLGLILLVAILIVILRRHEK
jgi:LPXTG-motif cell wall-anchored protein